MEQLIEYIHKHTERGECQCGKCIDNKPDREPSGPSVDVHFFWVSTRNDPTKNELLALLEAEYPEMDRLRGGPSYIEIGGVIGDQGDALRLIGLGELVGLWKAITPKSLHMEGSQADMLAGQGLIMASGLKP